MVTRNKVVHEQIKSSLLELEGKVLKEILYDDSHDKFMGIRIIFNDGAYLDIDSDHDEEEIYLTLSGSF